MDELEPRWEALMGSLPRGPATLASHPSAEPQLSEAARLPGVGRRTSDAVARTAVSLAFLRAFHQQLVQPLCGENAGLTTKEVVERFVKPLSAGRSCLADRLPSAAVGAPTAFVSHAWGTCHASEAPEAGSFALLVASVSDFFANAVAIETFIWLDIFAVDQHTAQGSDLDGGRTLEKTVEAAAHTLVVLDRGTALPLTRLWCLYEIGATPPEKLQLLTRGFGAAELRHKFRSLDVGAATCWDREDGFFDTFIRGQIERVHGSQALFEQKLKLRLLLKPTSYEADMKALLSSGSDAWTFETLRDFVCADGDDHRLACIAAGPGEGKSTIAAALCREGIAHAFHFCKASDVSRQDVGAVAASLAYQLAIARAGDGGLRFEAFAQALLSIKDEALEALADPSSVADVLLNMPLIAAVSERVVLLFDGLDEAGGISKVLNVLLELGRLEGVKLSVIVTTRPEQLILDALQARWKERFRRFEPSELRTASADSKLLSLLRSKLQISAGSVDEAYMSAFDAVVEKPSALINILLTARQPPALSLLEAMGVREQRTALPGWGVLFYERDYCVHLLHKSLADWLLDTARSSARAADVRAGHEAWTQHLMDAQVQPWMGGGDAPPTGSYVYSHLLAHLDESGRGDESVKLLTRLPWLQAMLRERGIWMLIREVAVRVKAGGTLAMLLRTLRLSAPGLTGADADVQLLTQLVGRLGWVEGLAPELTELVKEARAWRGEPWLCPITPTLREPVGPLEAILERHTEAVTSIAVSADGRIVSGSDDNTVRIWNATTGECERVLEGHTGGVKSVATAADGRIVSGSSDWRTDETADNTVRIWNAATGECERVLEGHTGGVWSVLVFADRRIVSGSLDATVRIWNAATGKCERVLEGHESKVRTVAVTADGCIVSGSGDNTVRIWNASTGECERVLEGHTGWVDSVTVAADGHIVSGSADNTLRIWKATLPNLLEQIRCHVRVTSVSVATNGRIVSAGEDAVHIWDAATGLCELVLDGHSESVSSVAVVADGHIVSGSYDKTVRIWNATTGDCEHVLEGHTGYVNDLLVTPDGHIASVPGFDTDDRTVAVWNVTTGECERVLDVYSADAKALQLVASKVLWVCWKSDPPRGRRGEVSWESVVAAGRNLPYTDHAGHSYYCVTDTVRGRTHVVCAGNRIFFFKVIDEGSEAKRLRMSI